MISQGFHRGFTAAEKMELWDRWQRGELLKAIGRAFSKPSSSIYFQLAPHGGIRPAARRRARLALTLSEREEISRGIAAAQSARSMARLLGRSPSTVSRELDRNGGYDRYRAALADEMAWARAYRPKRCKLANNPRLRQAVAGKLRLNWSPEQIAGWLKRWRRGDECNHVSHETIYRSLFVQTRGVLKKELLGHLRSKRTIRRSLRTDPNGDRRGQIKDIVSIEPTTHSGHSASDFAVTHALAVLRLISSSNFTDSCTGSVVAFLHSLGQPRPGRANRRTSHVRFSSLIGRFGSSAFRLSAASVSMWLTGSRFSSESAPRPFHCGIRG